MISFVVNNNSKSQTLNVTGCVELQGKIDLKLDSQQTDSTLQLINFNCTQVPSFSESQIVVTPNYQNSECDQISSKSIVSTTSLSVFLNSVNNKCGKGGLKTKHIVAIVFSIFGAFVLVAVFILLFKFKERLLFKKKLRYVQKELTNSN